MNTNLNFAQTFPPTKDYIINILRVADGQERTLDELYEYTGIPGGEVTGKLKPHLDYAQCMGLIQYSHKQGTYVVTKTLLGEKVYLEDFSISEDLTLQLINYNMSSNTIGSEVWNVISRKTPINKVTNLKILYNAFDTKYNKKESSTARIIAPFRSAQEGMFQQIDFVSADEESFKFQDIPVRKQNVYMYGYALLTDWEYLFPHQLEITFEDISNNIQWGMGFGWNDNSSYEALQICEDYGIIKINKQLSPMTIVKNMKTIDVVKKLYALL